MADTSSPTPQLPDPCRLGGPEWLRSTGGRLTAADRRMMWGVSLRTQRALVAGRLGRRRRTSLDSDELMRLPDSRLVRTAEEAALVQSPALLAHGYRTAVFAQALAVVDRVAVDRELLVVCGLLHDAGLVPAVAGEDFTVRSAAIAAHAATDAGREDAAAPMADAITVHTTVGVDPATDGALGAYTQFGALVDLLGLRERDLPHDLVARTVAAHPRAGFAGEITRALRAEARAVPGGRFDFLRRTGFVPAVHLAAVPSRR